MAETRTKEDIQYQKCIEARKVIRGNPDKQRESEALLERAFSLMDTGKVSENTILAMQYL